MFCGLPESTRCFLRSFGLIDKEATLFQAGLLTTTDIEDASDHVLLAAGMDRDQIRKIRRIFVFRDAFGLPDRVKPERSQLNVPFESSPRPITPSPVALRTSTAAHSEARLHEAESSRSLESSPRLTTSPSPTTPPASLAPHSASEMSSPSIQVAVAQDAVSEDFRRFLGTLGLSSKQGVKPCRGGLCSTSGLQGGLGRRAASRWP